MNQKSVDEPSLIPQSPTPKLHLEHVTVLLGPDGVEEAEGAPEEWREPDAEDRADVPVHRARDDAVLRLGLCVWDGGF